MGSLSYMHDLILEMPANPRRMYIIGTMFYFVFAFCAQTRYIGNIILLAAHMVLMKKSC